MSEAGLEVGGGVLCIYSVSLCICIQMLLLWNHFYSNARLMRPSFERNSREEWMHGGKIVGAETLILSQYD